MAWPERSLPLESRLGITVLKMSMPYHDRRMANGHERADQICGPNIGLTLQANRQAVQDARRCLRWLEQQGHTRLGILGTSLGSSVGYITLMHDPPSKPAASSTSPLTTPMSSARE